MALENRMYTYDEYKILSLKCIGKDESIKVLQEELDDYEKKYNDLVAIHNLNEETNNNLLREIQNVKDINNNFTSIIITHKETIKNLESQIQTRNKQVDKETLDKENKKIKKLISTHDMILKKYEEELVIKKELLSNNNQLLDDIKKLTLKLESNKITIDEQNFCITRLRHERNTYKYKYNDIKNNLTKTKKSPSIRKERKEKTIRRLKKLGNPIYSTLKIIE